MDQIHTHMRPLLMMLGDYRSLTLNVVNRLTSVTRLFPNSFNDKFCDQMMVRIRLLDEKLLCISRTLTVNIQSLLVPCCAYSVSILSLCLSQQHLRKWMEVVVITHKGGQRSDGSVSIHSSDSSIHTHTHLTALRN